MDGSLTQSSSKVTAGSTLRPRGPRSRPHSTSRPSSNASSSLAPQPEPSRSRSRSPLVESNTLHRSESANPIATINGRASPADRYHRLQSKGSAPSLAALWGTSWTAIQGIANDLLASDGADVELTHHRRVPRSGFLRSTNGSQVNKEWGPKGNDGISDLIGAGSRHEERDTLVRAQKRKDLLSGGPSIAFADGSGRFKRRTSDDRGPLTENLNDQGLGDALVYVHNVDPRDTLAGITIKYGCTATTLRKANRMWPNDSVQSKKVLVLPVTSCSIKGKPTESPEKNPDIAQRQEEQHGSSEEQPSRARAESFSNNSQRTTTSARSASEAEQSWTHDSWALLPNATAATQIVRLPRRVLGYFPPARRKSQSTSDFGSRATSLDISRLSNSDDPGAASPGRPPPRPRRPSNATNGYFPSYLAGPGGVGTMDRNVRSPGPAQDGLNKFFANHLPNVAPPANQHALYQPDTPLFIENLAGFLTPSLDPGPQSPRINLENVGGAIESWVRKVATKASSALEPADRREPTRTSGGYSGRGAGSVGDLIEMADSFDLGNEDEDSDDERDRGRQGSVTEPEGTSSGHAAATTSSQSRGPAAQSAARSRVRSTGKADAGKDD